MASPKRRVRVASATVLSMKFTVSRSGVTISAHPYLRLESMPGVSAGRTMAAPTRLYLAFSLTATVFLDVRWPTCNAKLH
jgi:hypothetical protein